jgi:penicillin-binding protein 1C
VDWRAVSRRRLGQFVEQQNARCIHPHHAAGGLLDDDLTAQKGGRSVVQKLGQTVSAQWLERRWRKDQILEAYLNLVPFRGELVGIDALSQTLFGKAAHGLDLREAALAAALVRAPNAPGRAGHPASLRRAQELLEPTTTQCRLRGMLDLFTTAALQRRDYSASEGWHRTWLARQNSPATQSSGTKRSTGIASPPRFTRPLQRFAVQTLQQHLRELAGAPCGRRRAGGAGQRQRARCWPGWARRAR